MKRLLIIVFIFVFVSGCLSSKVSADTTVIAPSASPPKNDYKLPYPGILPDNPFYKLKVLRDKIMAFLISDPEKKVNFYLLQTDKQIAMIPMLVNKKEVALAQTTALKGEDNFTQLMFVYRNSGTKPDTKTYQKLEKAANKHQEILASVMQKVNTNDAKTFQQVINFSQTNIDYLDKMYSQNH